MQSLNKLQEYASLIGLDRKTGIELSEATPKVSDAKAVPSYMGQGNNLFTTSELARYATVMATSGNIFKLPLLLQDHQTENESGSHDAYHHGSHP